MGLDLKTAKVDDSGEILYSELSRLAKVCMCVKSPPLLFRAGNARRWSLHGECCDTNARAVVFFRPALNHHASTYYRWPDSPTDFGH